MTGDPNYLTGRDCPHQTGYNNFKVRKVGAKVVSNWYLGLYRYIGWYILRRSPICTTRWLKRGWLPSSSTWKKWLFRRFLFSSAMGTYSMNDVAGGLSQFTVPHLPHIFKLRRERRFGVCKQRSFAVIKKPARVSGRKGVEKNDGGAPGTSKDDKTDKQESKTEGSAAGCTNTGTAPCWKITAGSIPQNYFTVRSFTSFAVSICLNTIVTDYKLLWIELLLLLTM